MTDTLAAASVVPVPGAAFGVMDLIRAAETLKQTGQHRAAESLYAGWIQDNPDDTLLYAVLFNYSVLLTESGNLVQAGECLRRAISLNPDFMPAYINFGRIHERSGAIGDAVGQWLAVTEKLGVITGTNVSYKTTALNQAARALEAVNQDAAAEDVLRQSLDIDPHQREVAQHYVAARQRQCEWPVIVPWERVGRETLARGMSPLSAAAYTDDPIFHLAGAWHYNKTDVGMPPVVIEDWPRARAAEGPLRIGYVSSDLREHAVGHLMAEVFGLHDRSRVEVFAYYCGVPAADPLHEHYKATADQFVSISQMDDASAARRIADDGIQILVDVNGYTRDARTRLFAARPAPVIVNWLGYPGTMASPYHHYIVADDFVIPESHELYYTEKVLRLPCYQPNNRKRVIAEKTPTRAEMGLPGDGTVFCSFNGTHKLTRFTFDRWLAILGGVPGSVLWLLSGSEAVHERLRSYAKSRGIAPERLVFAAKMANPEHMARYPLADLFLDSTPYGAHTTASDALWMGVPVLTCAGRSFASRVCGSLIRAAGVPELVCESAESFVAQGIALGRDRARLAALRERILAGRDTCTLFDTPGLVRGLEDLYGRMWNDYRNGALPRPDLLNLDAYFEVGVGVDHEETEVQTIADYHGWWLDKLARRDAVRPLPDDARLMAVRASRRGAG
ncbi:glycosyl transferase [Rhodoplanes sp. TEM]|uniref:protein O-GlcNAc transferase n=1 Tax=Rhodoplanes tepidamans TaxID=200616 RepID=A0ABT5J5P5_RHOTP|nr:MULTISPECIES: glycosyl transferase [Rhodoplanes]MDC7784980.1 glycosyl transferase [Rhodoplanes tepidamans]MDC7985848.1 glycosyl transferase [Rhodoplanes sp. TEM]MDQ0353790.1 putative O-linked N-acetylglucosamine transferase (SPINDLY family) [Rhodoplanes tepidamans]